MADFDLVDQLAQLRQALGGAPTSLSSYAAPPTIGETPIGGSYSAPPTVGFEPVGGTVDPGVLQRQGLVAFGGKQVSGKVAPHFTAMQKQFPGLRFTSGYRDPEHNAKVNGVKNSRHLNGDAGDWAGSAGDMQRGAAWAKANGAREVLIHNAGSGQHLHVAW